MSTAINRLVRAGGIAAAILGTSLASADCGWYAGPAFPGGPRRAAAGVNDHGTLVVLGGRPYVGENAAVHYLPPGGTTWQSGPPLDGPIMQPAAAIDGLDRLIVVGGYVIDDHIPFFFPLDNGFVYDLQAGTGDGIAALPTPRAWFAHVTDAERRLYVIGGRNQAGDTVAVVERYDAVTNAWSTLVPLPQPRSHAAAVEDGLGHILLVGGADGAGVAQDTVFSYDVAAGVWSVLDPEPVACLGQIAMRGRDGRVYFAGGSTGNGQTAGVYVFDPVGGDWTEGPSLATPRSQAAAVLDDTGVFWILGGESGSLGTATVERLDTNVPAVDCNGNGVLDACDILWGSSTDCNGNGVPDECDVASGTSRDANGNGTPDECEQPPGDLDHDGDVDIDDFEIFAPCMQGPGRAPATLCDDTDFDRDGDTDLRDFAALQR